MAEPHPTTRYSFGERVRVHCNSTGRYVCDGWALVVSAMDNSLFLARPVEGGTHSLFPVPSDDALSGAFAVLTSLYKVVGAAREVNGS